MKKILGLTTLFVMLSGQAFADQITLKNGDRVSGKIVKSDGGKLLVKTDLLGDVTVDLASVVNLTGEQTVYVTTADGRTLSGVLNATGDKVELRAPNQTVVAIDRAAIQLIRSEEEQIAYENSLNPGWLEGWDGGANLGLALTSGNSDTINVGLGLGLTRATIRDKTTLTAAAVYGRDSTSGESRTTANTIRGGLRYDRDINRKFFGYGFTDLEHNELQDLSLRLVLGGGLGYHAIRNDRTQLDLLGGLAWNREYFSGDFSDRSSAEAQFGQTLAHRLNPRVSLTEQLFIFPNLSNSGEYRINFDATLAADMTRRIEDAKREADMAMMLRPDDTMILYNTACAFCAMNNPKDALTAIKKAWEAGFQDPVWTRQDPDLALLHGDPEFERLYPAPNVAGQSS